MKVNGKIGFASQERQIGRGKMLKPKTGEQGQIYRGVKLRLKTNSFGSEEWCTEVTLSHFIIGHMSSCKASHVITLWNRDSSFPKAIHNFHNHEKDP